MSSLNRSRRTLIIVLIAFLLPVILPGSSLINIGTRQMLTRVP